MLPQNPQNPILTPDLQGAGLPAPGGINQNAIIESLMQLAQQQAPISSSPMGQFAQGGSELLAPIMGQPSPMMGRQQAQGQTMGLLSKAVEAASQDRERKQQTRMTLAEGLMKDPSTWKLGLRERLNIAQEMGMVSGQETQGVLGGILKPPITKETWDRVASLIDSGAQPQDIMTVVPGVAAEDISLIGRLAQSDPERISKRTKAELETENTLLTQYGIEGHTPAGQGVRRMAVQKYGKPFSALTPAQRTDVINSFDISQPGEAKLSDQAKQRGEFNGLSKEFITVRDAYGRVLVAAKDPSAAGDLAMIFSFMKMLDPGSTVRESEFANAANAAGVPERIRNTWNRLLTGTRLGTEGAPTRQDFMMQAQGQFATQRSRQMELEADYTKRAIRNKMKPEDVIVDFIGPFRPQPKPTPAGPLTRRVVARDKTSGRIADIELSPGETLPSNFVEVTE